MYNDEPVVEGPLGLPDEEGFLAVLEAEEQRAKRHGGIHGLVLIELELGKVDPRLADDVAVALSRSLRETDLLAQIDHRTFGVLALHCHALETVVARLHAALDAVALPVTASLNARSAGLELRAAWSAMVAGDQWTMGWPAARYIPFVASLPVSLN